MNRMRAWLLWGGPLRLVLWRWRRSEAERVRLKQRVRDLERRLEGSGR